MRIFALAVTSDFTYKENTQSEASKRNIQVDYVKTMDEALEMVLKKDYILVVIRADTVDYLPKLNILKTTKPIPILVFSYVEPDNKEEVLRMGADVYIVTPYEVDYIVESSVALARLYLKLNETSPKPPTFLTCEYLLMCVESYQVFLKGKEIKLTKKEFELLQFLMENRERVFNYRQIFSHVWGDEYADNSNCILWSHIKALRKKLCPEPESKDYIINIRNVGYKFSQS